MPKKNDKNAGLSTPLSGLRVVALVYDGLCTFEFGIAAEVFGLVRPELDRELYQFSSVTLERKKMCAAGGLIVRATGTLADFERAHTIVIPGWRNTDEPVPNVICHQLHQAHERGARLLSICSGGYVLAAAGLLNQRNITTHWQYAEDMKKRFPSIIMQENQLYVDEGDIVTSAGSSAGIDACLHIVRTDYGARIANMVARRLVMHSHRQGNQTQFIDQSLPKTGDDERLSKLMDELRISLSIKHTISSMAEFSNMSTRTFQRRFLAFTGVPAMKWLARERVSAASQLLETTDLSIDKISASVGFSGAETLRYHFRETLAVSPIEYKRRFSAKN